LQCVAVCCSVLQCVAVCCRVILCTTSPEFNMIPALQHKMHIATQMHFVLQCVVALCCRCTQYHTWTHSNTLLQHTATQNAHCNTNTLCVAARCSSVLPSDAVWFCAEHVPYVLCVAVRCSVLQCAVVYSVVSMYSVLHCVAVCCSVLQCVAKCCHVQHGSYVFCCSALQCVAVCCSVLPCTAVKWLINTWHDSFPLPLCHTSIPSCSYGVALLTGIDKIIGLFCKRAL